MRQASKKRSQNRPQPLQKSSSFLHARGRNRAFMTAPVTPASHARHNHALPCPHPHVHRKGRRLAKDQQVTRCTCPNMLCDWHGKRRECVALHRYHKSHVPFCLQIIIKDRVQPLTATVEMETVPVQPTPGNTDSTCLSATGNAQLWQKTATSSQPQRRKRMRGARGQGSSPLARR